MRFRTTSTNGLIDQYKKLATDNIVQKIDFYLENEPDILRIPIDERFEIEKDFLSALFQNGQFKHYLEKCEPIISQIFDAYFFPKFDKDSLSTLLFYKAASQFNLRDYQSSKHTIVEIIKLESQNKKLHQELLRRIFIKEGQKGKYVIRGVVIAMILTSALVSISNAVVIQPFYPKCFEIFQFAGWFVLAFALTLWGGTYFYAIRVARIAAQYFIEKSEKGKVGS